MENFRRDGCGRIVSTLDRKHTATLEAFRNLSLATGPFKYRHSIDRICSIQSLLVEYLNCSFETKEDVSSHGASMYILRMSWWTGKG